MSSAKKLWYFKNRAKRLAQQKAYAESHVDYYRQLSAKWRSENLDYKRSKDRLNYHANRDAVLERVRAYQDERRDERRKYLADYAKANPAKFRESSHRRRARVLKNGIEPVNADAIYERDRGICQICAEPVDRKVASLDHIVPVSKGGPHAPWNVQLAHLRCNQVRGVGRKIVAQIRLPL